MKMHELLDSPEKWCRKTYALGPEGERRQAVDPAACRWCALGAAYRVYPNQREQDEVVNRLHEKVGNIPYWNDSKELTFEGMRAVLLELDI